MTEMTEMTENQRIAAIRALAGAVPDPEIPVLDLADLGILRDVIMEDGIPVVLLTPTFTGCPATEAIAAMVRAALDEGGFHDARVRTVLAPAWTSDWLSEDGRRKLREYGIAPPACMAGSLGAFANRGAASHQAQPSCPRCGSAEVEPISRWGSTPCKALYRCRNCLEPFDYFRPH